MTQESRWDAGKREVVQAVYDLMKQRGDWPTFTAVDLWLDRELGIEDAQAALLATSPAHMFRPWQSHGFSSNDPVRLTLHGMEVCEGGHEDLQLLADFMAWAVELERNDTGEAEDPLVADSKAFATHAAIHVADDDAGAPGTDSEEAASYIYIPAEVEADRQKLARLRVLTDLLPGFWSNSGWASKEPWRWHFSLDRPRLRPYRRVHGVEELLRYVDTVERERAESAAASLAPPTGTDRASAPAETESENVGHPQDRVLDVQLNLLRREILDSCEAHLRADLFDEAIFAAFRRLEDEVQRRRASSVIGNDLINAAFKDGTDPIRISDRDRDMDRMVQLFAGAIGLFKGDRSHKDQPDLPCTSRPECLRILAHASSLLDLLDRDTKRAPAIRGYQYHQGDLTLWVDRAGSQTQVWMDKHARLTTRSVRPGALVVDVSAVSAGEHRIHLVDGTRRGPTHTVWLVRNPGRSTWYRVVEVGVPLYGDALGRPLLNISGVRLEVMEGGIASQRVVPTRQSYQVGHYVEWESSRSREQVGPAWAHDPAAGMLRPVLHSVVLDGQPSAPAHESRLMRISIEPEHLRLRTKDIVPLRVLGHYTDGTAVWTEPIDSPRVSSAEEKIAFVRDNTVMGKTHGATTLRCEHKACYAEARVDVAAHPRWSATELLTNLPPVSGIAWTPRGLVVSTRGRQLWRVDTKDNAYRMIAIVPPVSAHDQGTDTIAARSDGELAVRVVGDRRVVVLHHGDDYQSSEVVSPEADGVPMAIGWTDDALLVAMDNGSLHRVEMDGSTKELTRLAGTPIGIASTPDSVLVLCGPSTDQDYNELWSIPLIDPATATDLLQDKQMAALNGVTVVGSSVVLSDFTNGRVYNLHDGRLCEVADGLANPGQLATGTDGEIYVAEFGAGAIRCLLS
ncbi:TIGR02391 family protein [Kitasatospora indigofera]|uniref:TIGR02391 family protein n=1 Tax=Kitasatospora indigofera TaxID=67307 RepID=UPI00365D41C7